MILKAESGPTLEMPVTTFKLEEAQFKKQNKMFTAIHQIYQAVHWFIKTLGYMHNNFLNTRFLGKLQYPFELRPSTVPIDNAC